MMERGLRQGDPLSLFLFLIVAEALQVSIIEACNKGIFKGMYLTNNRENISLLQIAGDALFFKEWSRENAKNLIHILHCFKEALGPKINLTKSRLFGISVANEDLTDVASSLGCTHNELPFIYLGLHVGLGTDHILNSKGVWCDILKAISNIKDVDAPFRYSFSLMFLM
ncbi:arginine repressor C-terminal-like domain-containing protein, partial [Tanacetum coccineum]